MTEYHASRLLQSLHSVADVQILDESHGLFGELYDGRQVLEALLETASTEENVGTPHSKGMVLRSQDYAPTTFLSSKGQPVTPHEMPLEVHNTSNSILRLRWMDTRGAHRPATHQWDIPPSSTFEQYTQPGHLFLLSIVNADCEQLLGAYRPKRALPSLTPHVLLVQGIMRMGETTTTTMLLETLLLDESKFDALAVAAADLDHHHDSCVDRDTLEQTIHLLQTIVRNVLKHPKEKKYHKLRCSNETMRRYLVESWGAMELLRLVGFVPTSVPTDDGDEGSEDCLVLSTPTSKRTEAMCQQALQLLELLQTRVAPTFVADLAPPTPWQSSLVGTTAGGGHAWLHSQRGFITPDERWARAERVASLRRSGAARRPAPGEAPSSRGNWGR
jgi:hypothetical protein